MNYDEIQNVFLNILDIRVTKIISQSGINNDLLVLTKEYQKHIRISPINRLFRVILIKEVYELR